MKPRLTVIDFFSVSRAKHMPVGSLDQHGGQSWFQRVEIWREINRQGRQKLPWISSQGPKVFVNSEESPASDVLFVCFWWLCFRTPSRTMQKRTRRKTQRMGKMTKMRNPAKAKNIQVVLFSITNRRVGFFCRRSGLCLLTTFYNHKCGLIVNISWRLIISHTSTSH